MFLSVLQTIICKLRKGGFKSSDIFHSNIHDLGWIQRGRFLCPALFFLSGMFWVN